MTSIFIVFSRVPYEGESYHGYYSTRERAFDRAHALALKEQEKDKRHKLVLKRHDDSWAATETGETYGIGEVFYVREEHLDSDIEEIPF